MSDKTHIFNALRREFSDEFPDLSLVFIPYEYGHAVDALKSGRAEIESHPAGHAAYQHAEKALESRKRGRFCAAFEIHTDKSLFGLLKKKTALGLCFVPQEDMKLFEDSNFAARHAGYAAAFEALDHYLKQKDKAKKKNQEGDENISRSSQRAEHLRNALMADCFATMMIEHTGTKSAIQKIIKRYCALSTETTLRFWAEDHPMPMAFDGLSIVYKDLKDEPRSKKIGPIQHIHMMSREIGSTYDDISLMQWIRFAHNAQEMAYAGGKPSEILSAAIYSADNPHIRANAHIFVESLNINPVPLKSTELYNTFAGEETLERQHWRLCRSAFDRALNAVEETGDTNLFFEHARAQTQKFLNGTPMGWCAPALIEAENAYKLFQEMQNPEDDMIANAFEAVCSKIKWRDLQRLNRKLMELRRMGYDVNAQAAHRIIGDDETYAHYKSAFEMIENE